MNDKERIMMDVEEEPIIDGRDRTDILRHLKEIAPYYVEEWDPEREDAGTVLFEIFSDLTEDVIDRLDRVPEKHQAAFLNALDFESHPPKPATLPIQFQVDDTSDENVQIPTGTTAVADATDDRPEQRFETAGDRKFEATPATITDCFAVDPGTDRIVDHQDIIDGTEPTAFFMGENEQRHEYYLGHAELLNLQPGSVFELTINTNAPVDIFRDFLEWEYYGKDEAGEEGWHSLTVQGRQKQEISSYSEYQKTEAFIQRQVENLETSGHYFQSDTDEYETLIRAIIDDIQKGRVSSSRDTTGRLPVNLFETQSIDQSLQQRIQRQLQALKKRLESATAGNPFSGEFKEQTISLQIPAEITESEIDGIETRWIRCRIPEEELARSLFKILVDSVRLSVGSGQGEKSAAGIQPDQAIANDVITAFEGSQNVTPFGDNPTEGATFSIACEEAFTKTGATVTIEFDGTVETTKETDPELVWEYWNGDGWRRLSVEDDTDALRQPGTVTFQVPLDIAATSVLGHEEHWIRTRLVSGNYGELRIEETAENSWERIRDHISPPEYETVTIQYSQSGRPFKHQLTQNNLTSKTVHTEESEFKPFEGPLGEKQTIYLGFDAPLEGGPIHLFFPLEGTGYPHEFTPLVDVEYCSNPTVGEWTRLSVQDGTANLTERGILAVSFPEQTESFTLFGKQRHWIRIRLTGDEFARSNSGLFTEKPDQQSFSKNHHVLSRESITEREEKEKTRTPPAVGDLYLNTEWAKNTRTIENETLGSSDETANQEYTFEETPILDADIWIDELDELSKRDRQRLENDETTAINKETDNQGTLEEFWVRWTPVQDFFNSSPTAREYVIDRTGGTVKFGDGKNGAIPPAGVNNIRAEYQTGGGSDGNVEAGAVSQLPDELTFIDSVTNPTSGENGEDEESLEEFVSRAPKQLRDRGKPVTRDGFERIALSSAREVAKVQCKAGKEETGKVGHVTLLIVPETTQRKPTPSEELLNQVEEKMSEEAPEAVVADESNLTVRGPQYVEVSVTTTVEITGVQSTTQVQEEAESALTQFCHPLTGGPDGEGWEIGTVPRPDVFTASLEQLDNINRVKNMSVTYREENKEITLAGGEDKPIVAPDVLIHSGRHDVSVDVGGQ